MNRIGAPVRAQRGCRSRPSDFGALPLLGTAPWIPTRLFASSFANQWGPPAKERLAQCHSATTCHLLGTARLPPLMTSCIWDASCPKAESAAIERCKAFAAYGHPCAHPLPPPAAGYFVHFVSSWLVTCCCVRRFLQKPWQAPFCLRRCDWRLPLLLRFED